MEVERLDPRLDDIVGPSPELTPIGDGFATAEGPLWLEHEQALVFSEVGISPSTGETAEMPGGNKSIQSFKLVNNGRRWRWTAAEGLSLLIDGTNLTNGLALDLQGRFICCEVGTRRITRTEGDAPSTVVASYYQGKQISVPNDVAVKSSGSIYFTDTGGLSPGEDMPFSTVWRVSPDLGIIDPVASGFQCVNGLAFSPDESILYVADSHGVRASNQGFFSQGSIIAYDVRTSEMLCNRRLFCELRGELSGMPDGLAVDVAGNVYSTGPGGIWVIAPDGTHLGTLLTAVVHHVNDGTNLAFGGPNHTTLFFTTSSTLSSVELRIPGVRLPGPALGGS